MYEDGAGFLRVASLTVGFSFALAALEVLFPQQGRMDTWHKALRNTFSAVNEKTLPTYGRTDRRMDI